MSNNHSKYTIYSKHHHFGWNNSIDSVLVVKSGEILEIITTESSGAQLIIFLNLY